MAIASAHEARAVINPKFTPIDLVKQSTCIAELELSAAKDGRMTAAVRRVVQGDLSSKQLTLDLTKTPYKEQAARFQELLPAGGKARAMVFIARQFVTNAGDAARAPGAPVPGPQQEAEQDAKALLHVENTWLELDAAGKDTWNMAQISVAMLGTWNGGTDMLAKAVDYIRAEPDTAELPVTENVAWLGQQRFDALDGRVGAVMPVDLDGAGKMALYVACQSGDRLYVLKPGDKLPRDITASTKLSAKSRHAAWGDLDGDGRMDLVSADAQGLTVFVQQSDGAFSAGPKLPQAEIGGALLGLQVIGGPEPGQAVVLMNVAGSPTMWQRVAGRRVAGAERSGAPATRRWGTATLSPSHPTLSPSHPSASLGRPGPVLVADFDGDGLPDLLRVYEKAGLMHQGTAKGKFDKPKPCPIGAGKGRTCAFVGDFDADGLLDVVTVSAEDRTRLWVNRGGLDFVERFSHGGELSAKGIEGAIGGSTCDFNNDGRQDLVFYYAKATPCMFFNRGFRSFGLANGLDLGAHGLLPQGEQGQQAGCTCDLNGDGALEMVLVLRNGEAWICSLDPGDTLGRCARGVLAPNADSCGPLLATGWCAGRCLGAWNVSPGTSEAYVARIEAGPVTIKWQFPGGKPKSKEVILEDRPVRVVLGP